MSRLCAAYSSVHPFLAFVLIPPVTQPGQFVSDDLPATHL